MEINRCPGIIGDSLELALCMQPAEKEGLSGHSPATTLGIEQLSYAHEVHQLSPSITSSAERSPKLSFGVRIQR